MPLDLDTVPEFGHLHLGYSLPLHPSSPFWQLSVRQHFLSHSHHFFPLLTPVILQNFHYLLSLYSTSISVKFSHSVMSESLQPHGLEHTCQASLDFTESQSLLKLMSIASMMPFNHLILSSPSPPALMFPSIRVFSDESALRIWWPNYWSFSFSISPSNEYPGLISFRMNWLDLLAVQGTLKSLPQHHSSKASILQCSAFFMVQLSHLFMTTGKTVALTIRTFVDIICFHFNTGGSWKYLHHLLCVLEFQKKTNNFNIYIQRVDLGILIIRRKNKDYLVPNGKFPLK